VIGIGVVITAATAKPGGRVLAQAPPQTASQSQAVVAPPPPNAGPDTTTATFADWLMRCQVTSAGQPGGRTCEVIQNIILEGKTAPLAQLAFGRLAANQPLYFTVVLPTNVTFPSTVRITIDEKDDKPVVVPWTRCLPSGCFASLAMTDEVLKHWREQTGPGRLTFKSGAGQDTIIPISFRGLARALDALGKD
jgi:invasion protein IalB